MVYQNPDAYNTRQMTEGSNVFADYQQKETVEPSDSKIISR
jgi:hypothetical protein